MTARDFADTEKLDKLFKMDYMFTRKEKEIMKCTRCDVEMVKANLTTGMAPIYLSNKKKGVFETEKSSSISCYVCPKCGLVELHADKPQDIII